MDNGIKNVIVQDAEPADALSIRQLALVVNIDAWSNADYSDEIFRPDSFVIKATRDTELVGFVLARIVPGTMQEHSDADIYNIAVDPQLKRQGIGTKLLVSLLDVLTERNIDSVWLEVRESNSEAISFYKRYGFVAELTRSNFYTNPNENATIMRLRITPKQDLSDA